MKYEQRNPLPIPESGPTESVSTTMDTIFDWKYALERENLLGLYEKGKEATWNASDLDWSIEVDLEKTTVVRPGSAGRLDVFEQGRGAHRESQLRVDVRRLVECFRAGIGGIGSFEGRSVEVECL